MIVPSALTQNKLQGRLIPGNSENSQLFIDPDSIFESIDNLL